jgi:ribonuclease E
LKEDNVGKSKKPSYTLIQQPELNVINSNQQEVPHDEPAVKPFVVEHPTLKQTPNGFIKRLWTSLFGGHTVSSTQDQPKKHQHHSHDQSRSISHESRERRAQNPSNRRRRPSGGQRPGSTNPNQPRKKMPPHQQSQSGHQGNKATTKNEGNKKRDLSPTKEQTEK